MEVYFNQGHSIVAVQSAFRLHYRVLPRGDVPGRKLVLPQDATVFFSDEAHFHLSGYVNRQNMRYWSDTNLRELNQTPLQAERIAVLCALSKVGTIGPYCFVLRDINEPVSKNTSSINY